MANLKKVSVKQIKLSDLEEGAEFAGTLKGFSTKPITVLDEKSGEVMEKELQFVDIADDDGNNVRLVSDVGFRNALEDGHIGIGDWFKGVKLAKIKLPKGRTMNQYDIYTRT